MATIAATIVKTGTGGGPRVIKFEALDCVGGDDTAAIDTLGYRYAVVYGVVNNTSGATAAGYLSMRAISQDGGEAVNVQGRPNPTANTGELAHDLTVLVTAGAQANMTGRVVTELPTKVKFVHDGANTNTLTVDVIVELHR